MVELCGQFMDRAADILYKEGVSFTSQGLADIIMKHAPDWRRVLNECQRAGASGLRIDGNSKSANSNVNGLVSHLKEKNFKKMRQWVVNNMDVEPQAIIRQLYDNINESVAPQSVPQLVLILAEYQYKNAFVADHELNMVAMMTEIMAQVDFK